MQMVIQFLITLLLAFQANAQFFNFFGGQHQQQAQKQSYEDEFLNSEYSQNFTKVIEY